MSDFGNVLLVAFGIGLLIFVHELGHYLCARWIGVRVEVFSLGFGPRIWGFSRGGCDYRLSLIPLGGYVAVAGAEPGDTRYPPSASLHGKTVGQRMLFYSGGVVMNLLFALIAFPIAFGSGVPFLAPVVGDVEPGGAAWESRLQRGDRILEVAGKSMYSFDNLVVEVALAAGRDVPLRIRRGDEELDVTVLPQYGESAGLFGLGIGPANQPEPPRLSVAADSAAERAGLQTDDEVLAVEGVPTTGPAVDVAELMNPVLGPHFGQPLSLSIRRDGQTREVTVRPDADTRLGAPMLGVTLLSRRVGGIRSGLATLTELGLERGDVVLAIDGETYRGPDLGVVAAGTGAASSDQLTMTVLRGEHRRQLTARATPDDRRRFADHVALVRDARDLVLDPSPDGAARAAGVLSGDRLLAADGKALATWTDLVEHMQDSTDAPVRLEIERPGAGPTEPATRLTLSAQPKRSYDLGLGWSIERRRQEVRAEGFADAVRLGSVCALDLIKQLYVTMKRLLTGDVAAKNLGGIIQISRVSYHNVQSGMSRFLYFLALLSINLAFINVLPIPVLDGGHLTFLLIERIKGSPVSTRVLSYSQILGLVFVLALVVFVTYNDILRLL